MITQIIVYLFIIVLLFAIAFGTYLIITKELERRVKIQEERLKRLSQTNIGKEILEQEFIEMNKRSNKIAPFISIGYMICYCVFLCVGLSGTFLFIKDVYFGEKILDILFLYKGYYLFSPLILIYSIYKIVLLILKKINFIKQNKLIK